MQKIKMSRGTLLTFEEGCNKYLQNCRQRNLREDTINLHRLAYKQACRLALCRLSGAGNNPMVGMTVAVAIEEASK